MFANDGFKIRGWDETGLNVGSARQFVTSLESVNLLPFREDVGPRHPLDDSATPLDYLDRLFEPSFYDHYETNKYAAQQQAARGGGGTGMTQQLMK